MRLSTKGRYGLMALTWLVRRYGEGPVSLKEIAQQENLSLQYLEQLFASLRKDGIVRSVRGAKGGYELEKAPEALPLLQVLRSLEGGVHFSCCDDPHHACAKLTCCSIKEPLQQVQDRIEAALEEMSLADLALEEPLKKPR